MELALTHRSEGGVPVLEVQGEVDVSSAPQLQRELSMLQEAGAQSVIVDLSAVGFLDSTGLGALVAARAVASDAGGTVAIVCTQDRILKLFTITGLDGAFDIHPTIESAARSLAG